MWSILWRNDDVTWPQTTTRSWPNHVHVTSSLHHKIDQTAPLHFEIIVRSCEVWVRGTLASNLYTGVWHYRRPSKCIIFNSPFADYCLVVLWMLIVFLPNSGEIIFSVSNNHLLLFSCHYGVEEPPTVLHACYHLLIFVTGFGKTLCMGSFF